MYDITVDCCFQDPVFDKIIKALYGNVDQFDAEVSRAGSRAAVIWTANRNKHWHSSRICSSRV